MLIALLAVPVAASAHPAQVNTFAFDIGGSAKALTQAPDDGDANFATSSNMRLLGFNERTPKPVPNNFGTFISDLAFWGDRAYQGTWDGFRILDVRNDRRPRELLDFRGCSNPNGSGQGDVVIWGSVLVRTWDSNTPASGATCDGEPVPAGFEGVHVFDVSDPGNPDLVASVDLACGSHTASGVPDLRNRRLMVYSTPSSGACEGIDLVEVPLSRPAESEFLRFEYADRETGAANNFACHDTGIILGDVKKAACAGGVGFAVWSLGGRDGGSIDNPRFLYNRVVPEIVGPPNVNGPTGHSAAFSWDGETLIFGHEPGGGSAPRCQATGAPLNSTGGVQTDDMKSLFFFDVETGAQQGKWALTRPQTAQENCTIHNYNIVPTRRGDDVLVHGSYQSGIGVLDFTNRARAREIGYADPAPLVPTQLGGDWSSYFYNGTIYESDITRGLFTWEIDDRRVRGAMKLRHLNPQTQEFSIGAPRDRDRWDEDDRWHGGDWDDDQDD